jgi:large subunit ribosomal protein L1
MSKRSKRYNELKSAVKTEGLYQIADAIAVVKNQTVKFDASVELHIRVGIDTKKSDQTVRGSVVLPHGTGKTRTVIAFVGPNHEADAKAAGADIIGTDDMIAEIKKTGKVNFEVAIATPDMMKKLAPIARILGQKGLMPNPKTETVGTDVTGMVSSMKQGKVNFKNDDTANIHMAVGKMSFTAEQLTENIKAALVAVKKAKPSSSKGVFMQASYIASSMGPSLRIVVE